MTEVASVHVSSQVSAKTRGTNTRTREKLCGPKKVEEDLRGLHGAQHGPREIS